MPFIRVRAIIQLLPTKDSGRTMALRGSYRPNHNFGGPDSREMDVGFIEFSDGEALLPGEAIERVIAFWARPGLAEILSSGRNWRIQEGATVVGLGTVLDVMED